MGPWRYKTLFNFLFLRIYQFVNKISGFPPFIPIVNLHCYQKSDDANENIIKGLFKAYYTFLLIATYFSLFTKHLHWLGVSE